jgi:hypothetical protein
MLRKFFIFLLVLATLAVIAANLAERRPVRLNEEQRRESLGPISGRKGKG